MANGSSGHRSWRIGLVVDHPRRDLEGLTLLARALMARRQRPVLVPMYQQGMDQALARLDAIVVNYYRQNNADMLRAWRRDDLTTFVLDTEGGVLSATGFRSLQGVASSLARLQVADGVDGYLFWGAKLADAVRSEATLPENRIAVTGCPRFDLCSEPWRHRLGARHGDYILVNFNFSLINPAQTEGADQEINMMIAGGWPSDYVHVLVQDMREVFRAYLDCIDELTATLPGQRFRLRPHPFEDPRPYLARFSKRSNVDINGQGSVAMAIQRAACVLHLNCGTAVEAAMLGSVPLQLEFLNTPIQRVHAPLPARVSRPVSDTRELADLLRQPENAGDGFDLAAAVKTELQPYFGALDGRAADRAADFIVARLSQLRTRSRNPSLGLALRSGHPGASPGQILQGFLGSLLGTAAAARLREAIQPARRDKRLQVHRIASLLQEFSACKPGAPARPRRARHRFTRLPLESIIIEPAHG